MPTRCVALNLLAAIALAAAPSFAQQNGSESDQEALANAALETWEAQGKAACEAQQPACQPMADLLARAAASFASAHRLNRAMAVRTLLIDPRYHLDATPAGLQAAFDLADNHRAIGDFEPAATLYENAARRGPKMSDAPGALKEATALRLGLGQVDRAMQDVDYFAKVYGATRSPDALGLALAMIAVLVEREQYPQVKTQLASRMAWVDRSGRIDEQILAHTWLARSLLRLGDAAGATREYQRVRELWQAPQAVVRAIDPNGDDPRRLGKALVALGETLFFFAEQKGSEADAIRFPRLHGRASRDRVLKYTNTEVADWLKRKRQAIELAEREYLKIVRIEPLPPPQWTIAASARVGQLWDGFMTEFRATPTPDEWKGDGNMPGTTVSKASVRKAYFRAIDDALEPQRQQTKAAFSSCLQFSVKMQRVDSYSRMCSAWLSEHYPKEFPVIHELMPRPAGLAFPIPPSPVEPGNSRDH